MVFDLWKRGGLLDWLLGESFDMTDSPSHSVDATVLVERMENPRCRDPDVKVGDENEIGGASRVNS